MFAYAGATDLLDGYIARNFKNQASSLGSFLDPLSDKILVGNLGKYLQITAPRIFCSSRSGTLIIDVVLLAGWVFLALTYANLIPASLTGLIVSRDLFLVYAGLYIRYMSVVPPFTLQKYFDPTLPTATVQPTTISKADM